MNYRYYHIIRRLKHFCMVRSVDWVFINGAPAWQWLGEYATLDKMFYSLLFKEEAEGPPSYYNIFLLITFLWEAFIRNIIIILCVNCIIIIWINDDDYNNNNNNNGRVYKNYGRLQDLAFLFKIPMSARTNFFEIYRQFWHAPSEKVRQPRCIPTASPDSTLEWYKLIPFL